MPEGPEVKKFTDLFKKNDRLKTKFMGKNISAKMCKIYNHGKVFIIDLDNGMNIFIQPALKGRFTTEKNKYTKIKFETTSGTIYFNDSINLARKKYLTDEELDKYLSGLGPDISNPKPGDKQRFCAKFKNNRGLVANKLLRQDVASGSGNYMRAEAMYAAGLPHDIKKISPEQCAKLYEKMVEIAAKVYAGNYEFKVYGREKTPKGEKVVKTKTSGRTLWHV